MKPEKTSKYVTSLKLQVLQSYSVLHKSLSVAVSSNKTTKVEGGGGTVVVHPVISHSPILVLQLA